MRNANKGNDDLRLIEDYLPIEAISAEASREKSVRKGHISTLHLWWARRPLVACRAAVYGALVPADRWVKGVDVKSPSTDTTMAEKVANGKKRGLNRKAAKEFITKLCRYPKTDPTKPADLKLKRDTEAAIVEAQKHILEAHADRLTAELAEARKTGNPPAWVDEFKFKGDTVAYADIVAGRAPRPRVLDMFAGGGAIPLEMLRLGCEAYALDLNPVAHIIQLCSLVYPQKYGRPDSNVVGMTGPKNAKGEPTWGGLADEVRYWGNWVLNRVRKEIGDLYPPIPDPAVWDVPPDIAFDHQAGQWNATENGKPKRGVSINCESETRGVFGKQTTMLPIDDECEDEHDASSAPVPLPFGFLQPTAYLWTRTVRCKNPACGAVVPLVKQTWLSKKNKPITALRRDVDKAHHRVRFHLESGSSAKDLSFDPEDGSYRGSTACPLCGTAIDNSYVMSEGEAGRIGKQLMCIAARSAKPGGKRYISEGDYQGILPVPSDEQVCAHRAYNGVQLVELEAEIPSDRRESFWCRRYGLTKFSQLFTSRQRLFMGLIAQGIRDALPDASAEKGYRAAIQCYLACLLDKLADYNSNLCHWHTTTQGVSATYARQALPMVWDFPEINPFAGALADGRSLLESICAVIESCPRGADATVVRASATEMPFADAMFDCVITDPPYYDNISYAKLADYFYVWMRSVLSKTHPEQFAAAATPKKREAIVDIARSNGDRGAAKVEYEQLMTQSLKEAHRVLRPGGLLACVYAHKTTLGWSALINTLRTACFEIVEAWPLDTEMKTRVRAADNASLATSIFLIARRRSLGSGNGNYEVDVQPELQRIVRERVEALWEMGIGGADLVIACVGAGLGAFTKYERVEYANGEEVPAEKFLAEVEGVVLDAMMGKLSGVVGGNISVVDNASRFYVLWRFVYRTAEIEAGEAIVFANGTHIELDGPQGLSAGKDALVEKKKAKYRARDYTERGDDSKLGLPSETDQPAPLIDALHRILWLIENSPRKLNEFLDEAQPDGERLRVLAQALAGAALSGKSEEESAKLVSTTSAEQAALGKLLANWRSLVESRLAAEEGTLFGKQAR